MTRTSSIGLSRQIAASLARREWYVGAAAFALLALTLTLGATGAAIAQTTTSAPDAAATETTDGVATESTEAGTAETPAGEAVTGDAFSSALLPAPEGFEPLNAGMSLDSLELQVWPEYDATEVLVMADLHLAESVELPAEFQVAIPRGARLTGVAEVTPQGQFDYSRPAPTPNLEAGNEEWDVYNLTIPKIRDVRVEYYYNPGISGAGARSFPTRYRLPMDTQELAVSVQEPLRSTEFAVTPMPSQTTQDPQGFTYYGGSLGAASEGQIVSLQVDYSKPDAQPSMEGEAEAAAEGDSTQTMLLAVLGLMVVAIGGFAAYRLFLRPAPAATSGRRARSGRGPAKGVERTKSAGGGPSRYCTSCGAQLGKRDRFCPECGQGRE